MRSPVAKFLFAFPMLAFFTIACPAQGALISFQITFAQTFFHPDIGVRDLEGSFVIDDSFFGVGAENMTFGPESAEVTSGGLSDFTVSVNERVYLFDLALTQAVGLPPFSSVIRTGSAGEVIDIAGALTALQPSNIFLHVLLGRDGSEGEYVVSAR